MVEQIDPELKSSDAVPNSLADQLQVALAERDQFKENWARVMADHDNFRKRIYRERDEDQKYQSVPALKSLLPIFDGLDRAVDAASRSKNFDDLLNGVQLTIKQLETALGNLGVKPILAQGQPFDPNFHEAISQVPSADHPPMTVVSDIERGYAIHDRVVRPSKVIVSVAAPDA